MSLTQTYYLAHTARAKLSKEASRADHDLRLLVGHANLLDGLMLDLVDAEREQESWFNQSVRGAQTQEEPKHIQWADQVPTITEDYEEDDADSEDSEEEDVASTLASLRQAATLPAVGSIQMDEDEEAIDDDEEDYENLQLTRTLSHSSPPELMHESDSDSDEDSMPPSPPAPVEHTFASQKPQKPISQVEASFYEEGFYLPQRQEIRQEISVY